jgi:hypothetical protein
MTKIFNIFFLRNLFSSIFAFLNRWTGDCTIRTEDAAVSWIWFQHCMAILALVEKLAGIGGHGFPF